MTARVLRSDRSIGLERRPVLTLRDNPVFVALDLCGMFESDLHSPHATEVCLGGFIMGHEPVGQQDKGCCQG
jgi:D-arabinose 1-dehydrogenase-like Zn-dependent alcohol dehydrogenase